MRRKQRFRAFEKSVQIGYSWICAAEAFHRAFVYDDDESSFISISENEAKNKVLYVAKLLDGLEPWLRVLVPIPVHSREEIWFGPEGRPSIIRSLPASGSLRGRATHVYLDEIEHFRPGQDKDIFTASMGRVTRAHRRLTVGSSVFGEQTVLASIMRHADPGEKRPYPDFLKARLPWWVSEDESSLASISIARRNMDPADFAQEYECARTLVPDSFFTQDFIRNSVHDRRVVPRGELPDEGHYLAGFDVGASGHPSVLAIFQLYNGCWDEIVLERWRGVSLTQQQYQLQRLLSRHQGLTLTIDATGLGMQMSDELASQHGSRVDSVMFSQANKYEMTVNLRRQLEMSAARIARDTALAHQMNRTRKLPGNKLEQDTGRKRTSHNDEYWATALALKPASGEGTSVYEGHGLQWLDMDLDEVSA